MQHFFRALNDPTPWQIAGILFLLTHTDLAHFLITSTTREFRKKYLDAVLNAYLNQLDDILESQGDIQ